MDPLLTTIAVSAATSLVTKGAEAPARTLNLLWQATFGRIDPYLQNMIDKHNQSVRKYSEVINNEIDPIPKEHVNQNPDISIVGPALEASKYYVENETIRNLFAKLIAAEFDLRKARFVHHSFVNVIQQMSPNDAKLLSAIEVNGPLAEFRIYLKGESTYRRIGPRDILLIPPYTKENFENNSISINNLARLGIVEIDRLQSLINVALYEPYKNLDYYQVGQRELNQNPNQFSKFEIEKCSYSFTSYGDLFKKVCM